MENNNETPESKRERLRQEELKKTLQVAFTAVAW